MNNKRDNMYMEIAHIFSKQSTCLKHQVGCVITRNNRIICGGYNGAPSGIKSCKERNSCLRKDSESGSNLQLCYASHAEMNAICQAAKMGISIEGGTLYTTTYPCSLCAKLIINSGIKKIIYEEEYPDKFADSLLKFSNIEILKYEKN